MWSLKVYKTKTVLVKRNNEKIVVDIPFDVVDWELNKEWNNTLKISKGHTIKSSAINEWYVLNITDEIEAWIMDEYPDIQNELMADVKKRRKEGKKVNKEIVVNIIQRKYTQWL